MKSTGEFFKNPVLMLPFVYIFVLSTIFLLVTPQPNPENVTLTAIFVLLGLAVVQGLIGIIFEGAAITSYRDYLDKKNLSPGTQIQGGFKLYGKVLLLKLIQLVFVIVPAIILALIFMLIASSMNISLLDASVTQLSTLMLIFILIYLAYLLIMSIALMFSSAALSYKGTGPWQAIKESYKIFKEDTMHSFLSFVIVLVYAIIYVLIVSAITTILALLILGVEDTSIAAQVITSLLTLPLGGILLLYIFKAFKPEEGMVQQRIVSKKTTKKTAKKKATKKRK